MTSDPPKESYEGSRNPVTTKPDLNSGRPENEVTGTAYPRRLVRTAMSINPDGSFESVPKAGTRPTVYEPPGWCEKLWTAGAS